MHDWKKWDKFVYDFLEHFIYVPRHFISICRIIFSRLDFFSWTAKSFYFTAIIYFFLRPFISLPKSFLFHCTNIFFLGLDHTANLKSIHTETEQGALQLQLLLGESWDGESEFLLLSSQPKKKREKNKKKNKGSSLFILLLLPPKRLRLRLFPYRPLAVTN